MYQKTKSAFPALTSSYPPLAISQQEKKKDTSLPPFVFARQFDENPADKSCFEISCSSVVANLESEKMREIRQ
jgi:hypothetical protein